MARTYAESTKQKPAAKESTTSIFAPVQQAVQSAPPQPVQRTEDAEQMAAEDPVGLESTGGFGYSIGTLSLGASAAPAIRAIQAKRIAGRLPTPDLHPGLHTTQLEAEPAPNRTGMPDTLKAGVESLSGMSLDHVKVHYNSDKPSQLGALAYAQGSEIHVSPGQERHLPHEAWHVVQQAQGRVKPTMQMKDGVAVNDDTGLEHEADVMGAKAAGFSPKEVAADTVVRDENALCFPYTPQPGSGKEGTVAFASATIQGKMNESPAEVPHTGYVSSDKLQTTPFHPSAPVQRVPSDKYKDSPPKGKGIKYDEIEFFKHNGEVVPAKVIAVMKNPSDGGTPSVSPPGWSWLQKKFGKLKGRWVRFHIINAKLGGQGNDESNLIPTTHTVNTNSSWKSLETGAKRSAIDDSKWTYVEVALSYDNDFPAGIPKQIDATWGYYNNNKWEQVGSVVHLTQANPDDKADYEYYLPSEVTQTLLQRNYNLSQKEARKVIKLISKRWYSQNEFDEKFDEATEYDDREGTGKRKRKRTGTGTGSGPWYGVLNRIYVDDADEADGPFDIVFKK